MSILAHHLCHPLVCLSPLLGDLPLKLGQHLLPQARLHLPQVIHPKPFPGFRQDPLRVDPRRGLPSQSRADVLGRGGAVGGGLAGSRLCGGGGGGCPSLCTGWDRGLCPLLPLPLKGCGGGGLSTGQLGGGGRGWGSVASCLPSQQAPGGWAAPRQLTPMRPSWPPAPSSCTHFAGPSPANHARPSPPATSSVAWPSLGPPLATPGSADPGGEPATLLAPSPSRGPWRWGREPGALQLALPQHGGGWLPGRQQAGWWG